VIHVGEIVHKYGSHDISAGSASGRDGAGTLVGCHINVNNGFLTFTLNGRELPNKFQVHIMIMLKYESLETEIYCRSNKTDSIELT